MDKIRQLILDRANELELDLKYLSEKLGRNHAYLHQYINRGIPKRLNEQDRSNLAVYLKVSEEQLGGQKAKPVGVSSENNIVDITELHVDDNGLLSLDIENKASQKIWQFPKEYFNNLKINYQTIFMFEILDDVMLPTLNKGEMVMVDKSEKSLNTPGIFLLSDKKSTYVRRIERIPGKEEIILICDNEAYKNHQIPEENIEIHGKIVWAARKVS